jgi:SAM-dependent methyltransferase
MNLADIVCRQSPPIPWQEADNIPWNDVEFSQRMLKEHLSQDHDAASRRFEIVDRHVEWIHQEVLSERPSRILDLGCGPGLYLQRLEKLGHHCTGIDYSPSSIAYALAEAEKERLSIQYFCENIQQADFGEGFDLIMLIFGEFNVFPRENAEALVRKAHDALKQAGVLLIEPHTFAAIEDLGRQPRSWHSAEEGLFSDRPYLCLQENSWDSSGKTATVRYFIVDADTGHLTRHAASYQAYTDAEYKSLLAGCGFSDVRQYGSLPGNTEEHQRHLTVFVAAKSGRNADSFK